MNKPRHRTISWPGLITVIVIFVALLLLLFFYGYPAVNEQNRVFQGCWPDSYRTVDGIISTPLFWETEIARLDLGPLEKYFYAPMNHYVWINIFILLSLVGWCGSILLRVIIKTATNAHITFNPKTMTASFFLTIIGSIIYYLLSRPLMLYSNDLDWLCISENGVNLAQAGAILIGLFLILFFNWLEKAAPKVWGTTTGISGGDNDAQDQP